VVQYTLGEDDAAKINKRRADALANMATHQENSDGSIVHVGNDVSAGEAYPMIITKVWGSGADLNEATLVNGQVLLDGNDLFWVTSVAAGDSQHQYQWPQMVAQGATAPPVQQVLEPVNALSAQEVEKLRWLADALERGFLGPALTAPGTTPQQLAAMRRANAGELLPDNRPGHQIRTRELAGGSPGVGHPTRVGPTMTRFHPHNPNP
jgi:hypothetical protein